jgi:WhiB family redox-sensing transcriptional regulator
VPPVDGRTGSLGWMSRGACPREDPELFFPIAAAGPALQQISAAKTVCSRCTVHARKSAATSS